MAKLPEIPVPQVSRPHGNCKDCLWWAREFQREMVMTREGSLIPIEAIKQQVAASFAVGGKPVTTDQLGVASCMSAACYRFPQWQMQPGNHYCGSFEPEQTQ